MRATKFVESYFDAWNHGDAQRVAGHLVAEGTYCDIPAHQQHSRDELVASLTAFFAHDRHQYELIGNILKGEHSIAFQYRASSDEDMDRNGFSGSFCGAEFMTLSGDAAIEIADYYDIPGMVCPANLARVTAGSSLKHKYAKSGLNAAQLEEFKRRLEYIMQSEKAFLQPNLTLPKLAAAVDCSVNSLSQVINSGFGMSFFDYLNQHRIEYAMNLLSEQDGNHCAIVDVAVAVGFNSNSAFYAAFKKCSGQTPAYYRRAQLKKTH